MVLASGYAWPPDKIMVQSGATPAEMSALDLPIAVAILAAGDQMSTDLTDVYLRGELGSDGSLRAPMYAPTPDVAVPAYLYLPTTDPCAFEAAHPVTLVSSLLETVNRLQPNHPVR
jgi:hypothetical protein